MQKTITIDAPLPKTMEEYEKAISTRTPGQPIHSLHDQVRMLTNVVQTMKAEHEKVVRGYRLLWEEAKAKAKPPATSPTKAPEKPATASAPKPEAKTAPGTPGAFSTQAEALAAYNELHEDDARGREVFRAKHARILGLGAGDSEAANETFKTRAEAEQAYRKIDPADAYALEDFRKAHARILGLTRTSGGCGFNR